MEFTGRGKKSLTEEKIQRRIFYGVASLPLLFITIRIPFNHLLRKWTGGWKSSKSQEKINQQIYIDDINLFAKGARGVMVIVVGKGHGDTSSNPRWDWLHFT